MVTVNILESGYIYTDGEYELIGEIQTTSNTIKRIEIYPPYQGRGYGKESVRQFCEEMEEQGFSEIYIACITNPKLIMIAQSFNGKEVSSHTIPISPHPMLEPDKPDYRIELPLPNNS